MNRVFITGAGVVSPIGNNLPEFFQGIQDGRKGITRISCMDTSNFPSDLGAEVKGFKIVRPGDRKRVFIEQVMNEIFTNYIAVRNYTPARRILNMGAGLDFFDLTGYVSSTDALQGKWQLYSHNTYDIVKDLATRYNMQGGFNVNVTACVASAQAIGLSYRMLKTEYQDTMIISGGFDSMLNPLHYMGFYKLGALSNWDGKPEEACRPFDKQRCGLVLGEGAAALILQNSAGISSAQILAEIVGYSSTMDSYMVSDPHPQGQHLARAAMQAIAEAGITPAEIDCVHLHGTGTPKNELAETKAMQIIFPQNFQEIPVFSLKGQIGHLIAACGAVELLGVIYSLQNQQVPPTINFKTRDPDVPLRVIKDIPLNIKIRYILKVNAAFGGQNTAMVIKKYEQ